MTRRLLGILFFFFFSLPVFAAPSSIEDAAREANRIQREQRERIEQDRREEEAKRPRSKIEIETPKEPLKIDGGICRQVKEIRIEGATLMSDSARQELIEEAVGKCMNVSDIERVLSEITKYYLERGYVSARAYVQAQDLATGVLRILVVEGFIEKLMLDSEGGNRNANLAFAFPGVVGSVLSLRDIEQGLDQINRLPSNSATMDIKPGEQAGGSVVVIHNKPTNRLRANLTYDNYGSAATGEREGGVSITYDNPLGLNDTINITHRRNLEGNFSNMHSRSNSLLYSVGIGYLTVNFSYTSSDFATTIHPPGGDQISTGDSENISIGAEYIMYRDEVNRVSVTSNLATKDTKNYIQGQFIGTNSRLLSTVDLGTSWNTQLFDGVFSTNLGHAWGVPAFGALRDLDNAPDIAPRAQFRKWVAGANWMRPFQIANTNFNFSSALSGQYGVNVLFGAEQFSIGSMYSVRGYKSTSISNDTGYYWRNDLAMPFQWSVRDGLTLNIKPYIAYDWGNIRSRYETVGGRLSGAAVGLNISCPLVTVEALASKPVKMPTNLVNEGTLWAVKAVVNF